MNLAHNSLDQAQSVKQRRGAILRRLIGQDKMPLMILLMAAVLLSSLVKA